MTKNAEILFRVCGVLMFLIAAKSAAVPFGTFDPRSLAMGGSGVATAPAHSAAFYNPALLAQFDHDEDEGRNSVFILPAISARVSDTIEEVVQFQDQDYDEQLRRAIADFQAAGNVTNAQAVLDASLALQDGLTQIASGPLGVDGNAAFVLAIPSFRQGGAFVFSKRAVGDGSLFKTAEDEQLLDAYVDTMTFVVSGGTEGAPSPLVLDGNGQLVDQTANLTSSASAAAISMTELGLSMAGEFTIFKQKFALGITPKFINVETYATEANANDKLDENRDFGNRWEVTADIGIAKNIAEVWNVGLVVKNVVPHRYTTNINTEIRIDPQVRAGVAYNAGWGILALDLDVVENKAVGAGDSTQNLSLGAEWDLYFAKIRGGYNYNFSASGEAKKGLLSIGMQIRPFGMLLDVAYADSGIERAAALQTGFNF